MVVMDMTDITDMRGMRDIAGVVTTTDMTVAIDVMIITTIKYGTD